MTNDTAAYAASLVRELCALPKETEWVEFKVNNADPDEIGEYISALANSAALAGKARAYLVWGIEDATHAVVGTTFNPAGAKVGNEELENWLLRLLEPKLHFQFLLTEVDGKAVVVLEIAAAFRHPVLFRTQEFIRVGSYKKKLKDFPEKERALWRIFDQTPFEAGIPAERRTAEEVVSLLDTAAYFELTGRPVPGDLASVLQALQDDQLVDPDDAGAWRVTNLGAILFARRLSDFRSLERKAVRVIVYDGKTRVKTQKEQVGGRGYASGFRGMIDFIDGLLPRNEVIESGIRREVRIYPELAVRELVANALIHQDFFVTGAGPIVEVFSDRVEISNPGTPLVAPDRFMDTPPRSRNESLASLMRRMGVCEERGSGIDKVAFEVELAELPAPIFEVAGENTRVALLGPRPLTSMDSADRNRACYFHACLRYIERDFLTNSSIRKRFGIAEGNKAFATRIIAEAVKAGVIRAYDPESAPKMRKYVPYWA